MTNVYSICGALALTGSLLSLVALIRSVLSGRARSEPAAVKFRSIMTVAFFASFGTIWLGQGLHWQWATSKICTTVFFVMVAPSYFLSLYLARRCERRMREKPENPNA